MGSEGPGVSSCGLGSYRMPMSGGEGGSSVWGYDYQHVMGNIGSCFSGPARRSKLCRTASPITEDNPPSAAAPSINVAKFRNAFGSETVNLPSATTVVFDVSSSLRRAWWIRIGSILFDIGPGPGLERWRHPAR